jgi:hypothetical protein
VRRNIIWAIAAVAVIAILPTTGLANTLQSAVRSTPKGDGKQDAALIKPIVKKVNTLGAGLAAVKNGLNTAKSDVAKLKTGLAAAQSSIGTLKTGLTAAQGNILTLQTDDASAKTSITTINAELAAGTTALTQINAALTNSTTGLVGLNAARPQFGAFNSDGTIIGGTGQASGASGPKADSTHTASTGAYIVDFGNDVSLRTFAVNVFPAVGTSVPITIASSAQAVDCGASSAATALCTGLGDSSGSKNHVAVTIETQPATGSSFTIAPGDRSFSVVALSG